ncbi:hypothetical protein [Streptomyces luteogriseus]|uniref:hypothetical protein n=1 Tax=Streptomyces luteogriseus TaxID=68233 RepID=UPI0036C3EFA7
MRIEAFDFECDYGFNGTDGVEERLTTILGGGIGRLARDQLVPRIGIDGCESLVGEVRLAAAEEGDIGGVEAPAEAVQGEVVGAFAGGDAWRDTAERATRA